MANLFCGKVGEEMDREKVIKGLEYCEGYFNCCDKCPYWDGGTHCAADLAHDALALLKEQEELIKAMKRDLNLVRSCKVCGNWTECTPDAPPESEEFKMWRDCGGSCKLNWPWQGV